MRRSCGVSLLLGFALTPRSFELAILDSDVTGLVSTESGGGDDFGLIVKVGSTRAGSPVVPGEFVFLSTMGGLEGADFDTLDFPPGDSYINAVLVDLDLLDTVLDVETITDVYIVDANGGSTIDPFEVFSLNLVPEPEIATALGFGLGLLHALDRRRRALSS